jgi:hypothetical protein
MNRRPQFIFNDFAKFIRTIRRPQRLRSLLLSGFCLPLLHVLWGRGADADSVIGFLFEFSLRFSILGHVLDSWQRPKVCCQADQLHACGNTSYLTSKMQILPLDQIRSFVYITGVLDPGAQCDRQEQC